MLNLIYRQPRLIRMSLEHSLNKRHETIFFLSQEAKVFLQYRLQAEIMSMNIKPSRHTLRLQQNSSAIRYGRRYTTDSGI